MIQRRQEADFSELAPGVTVHGTAMVKGVTPQEIDNRTVLKIDLENSSGASQVLLHPCNPAQAALQAGDQIAGRFTAHRCTPGRADLIYATGVVRLGIEDRTDEWNSRDPRGAVSVATSVSRNDSPRSAQTILCTMALLGFEADAFREGDWVDSRRAREIVLSAVDRLAAEDVKMLRELAYELGITR